MLMMPFHHGCTRATIGIMALLLWASVACSKSTANRSAIDDVYSHNLVGTWTERIIGSVATLERTLTFSPDGTYYSIEKLTKQKNEINYQNHGRWSIANGYIYITVMESTFADIPIGHKTQNKIITLNETEAITESDGGIVTTAHRITH